MGQTVTFEFLLFTRSVRPSELLVDFSTVIQELFLALCILCVYFGLFFSVYFQLLVDFSTVLLDYSLYSVYLVHIL